MYGRQRLCAGVDTRLPQQCGPRRTCAGNDLFGSEWGADHRRAACDEDAFLAGDCTRGRLGIEFTWRTQVGIIVCVTFLATCSVMTGIKRGIAMLSRVGPRPSENIWPRERATRPRAAGTSRSRWACSS